MHLIYIDDSKDEKISVFSAICIHENDWQTFFSLIKNIRKKLKDTDGIYIYKELHAWEFVSGRGKISDKIISKTRRCQIFNGILQVISTFKKIKIINTVFKPNEDEIAFERLLNRINNYVKKADSNAVLICDNGKNEIYTKLRRKMGSYNPIPSQYGKWEDDNAVFKNIPINNIIEDPFFKDSKHSYIIQLADFCAYALLRREHQLESKNKYYLHKSFDILKPILLKEATKKDPDGIVRK